MNGVHEGISLLKAGMGSPLSIKRSWLPILFLHCAVPCHSASAHPMAPSQQLNWAGLCSVSMKPRDTRARWNVVRLILSEATGTLCQRQTGTRCLSFPGEGLLSAHLTKVLDEC